MSGLNIALYLVTTSSGMSVKSSSPRPTMRNEEGRLTDTIDMVPGGTLINIPAGQWHSLKSLESGTVLLECKDGPWEPLGEEDILN